MIEKKGEDFFGWVVTGEIWGGERSAKRWLRWGWEGDFGGVIGSFRGVFY
jgi:hypothetical protein